jgi:hypothetical protein
VRLAGSEPHISRWLPLAFATQRCPAVAIAVVDGRPLDLNLMVPISRGRRFGSLVVRRSPDLAAKGQAIACGGHHGGVPVQFRLELNGL